jgi:hypothetical protein
MVYYAIDIILYSSPYNKTLNLLSFQIHCCLLQSNFKVQKVKVKVTHVQALRLCTGRTAHRGSRGIVLPFHDRGTRR